MALTDRQRISSGAPWEAQVGYSRAVRVGPFVYVTGTLAARPDGSIIAPGDGLEQTREIFRRLGGVLEEAGATFADVVRTRMFITDMAHAEGVGTAHREVFGDTRPCTTMVVVSGLFGDGSVVEIEVDAVIGGAGL